MKSKAIIVGAVSVVMAQASLAQTDFYKADNGTALSQTGSWSGGVVPGTGDRVWFSGNTAARTAHTGVFNHNWIGIVVTNSAYNWTIGNNNTRPIRLGTEGIIQANGSTGGDFTIAPELWLLADQTWNVEDAARTLNINGAIIDRLGNVAGAGPVSITKTGAGTLGIGAGGTNSTFSGGLTINDGTVIASADNVLGTGTLTINNGGLFATNAKTQTNNIVIAGSTRINGNGVLSGSISGSGSITHQTGSGDQAFNLKLNGNNSGFSGSITNNGVLATNNKDGFGSANLVLNDGSSLAAVSGSQLTGGNALANDIVLNGISKLGASNTGGNFELAGDVSGSGGLAVTVLGGFNVKVTLSGANTYAGTTDVADGFLFIDGDNSGATGAVTVRAGATLGGSGTIGGAVTVQADGTLAAGNSPGTLTFTDDLTLSVGSTNIMEITDTAYDILMGDGANTLTVAGETVFDFTGFSGGVTNGYALALDSMFANWGSVDLSGATYSALGLAGGQSLDLSGGNLTVIPEPATLGLVIALGGGILVIRRIFMV